MYKRKDYSFAVAREKTAKMEADEQNQRECIICCDAPAVGTVVEHRFLAGADRIDACRHCMAKHVYQQWRDENPRSDRDGDRDDDKRMSAALADIEYIREATSREPSQFCWKCGSLLFKDGGCRKLVCGRCKRRNYFVADYPDINRATVVQTADNDINLFVPIVVFLGACLLFFITTARFKHEVGIMCSLKTEEECSEMKWTMLQYPEDQPVFFMWLILCMWLSPGVAVAAVFYINREIS